MKTPSKEDMMRAIVPSLIDLPTQYRPVRDFLMIIPLPEQSSVGEIILPDRSRISYNEGHIVAKGPRCTNDLSLGDCVTWNAHSEFKCTTDNKSFILLAESNVLMAIANVALQACPEGGLSEECNFCKGTGFICGKYGSIECGMCKGKGKVRKKHKTTSQTPEEVAKEFSSLGICHED